MYFLSNSPAGFFQKLPLVPWRRWFIQIACYYSLQTVPRQSEKNPNSMMPTYHTIASPHYVPMYITNTAWGLGSMMMIKIHLCNLSGSCSRTPLQWREISGCHHASLINEYRPWWRKYQISLFLYRRLIMTMLRYSLVWKAISNSYYRLGTCIEIYNIL